MKNIHQRCDIRFVGENDLVEHKDKFVSLLDQNFRISFPNLTDSAEIAEENYEDMLKFQKNGSAILIGGFAKTQIVGFLWAYRRIFLREERIHLSHIIISEQHKRHGIGTALIDTLKDFAAEKGIKTIELMVSMDNYDAVKFYETYGFSCTRAQYEMIAPPNDH